MGPPTRSPLMWSAVPGLLLVFALAGCWAPPPVAGDGGLRPDAADVDANRDGGDVPDGGADVDAGEPADGGDAGTPDAHAVLFIGNSFVHVNDVAGHYRAIVSGLSHDVRVEEVTPGGHRLEQHANDARTDGTALARWLRTGTPEETSFDAVVLQEQSQVGGYPEYSNVRRASVAAALELSALARERGARVVLYLTWGYEHGDPNNSLIGFGTYSEMQDRLDEGYLGLAALLREQGSTVLLAPVGGGFRLVFEDVLAAGGDPLAEGSDFDALYEPDGIHPSLRGAYLAACIIAGSVTGADVRSFAEEPQLGSEVSNQLLAVCERALADARWHVPTLRRADDTLFGTGTTYTYFGAGVATNADGSRILVGAPAPNANASAHVYSRADVGWIEEARWNAGALFGGSVALSAEGTVAVAGPPTVVKVRTGTTWAEEQVLAPGPAAKNPESTGLLALSADGARAIVSEGAGWPAEVRVPIYVRDAGVWQEEAVLDSHSLYGSGPTVGIDGNGERAIVGAYGDRAVRIYARQSSGWAEEATLPSQAVNVALSYDGSHAIVGEPSADRVVIFRRTGTVWSEESVLRGRKGSRFATSVSISAGGDLALVGAPNDSPAASGTGTGSARVYARADGGYRYEYLLVPPPTTTELAVRRFGASVALSSDGSCAVVGAPSSRTNDGGWNGGRAHTFVLP